MYQSDLSSTSVRSDNPEREECGALAAVVHPGGNPTETAIGASAARARERDLASAMQESSLSHVPHKPLSIFLNFSSRRFVKARDFAQLALAHKQQALRKIYSVVQEPLNCSGRKTTVVEGSLLSHETEREPCRSNCGLLLRLRRLGPLSWHASLLSWTIVVEFDPRNREASLSLLKM
jgi:hypothetical protein